MAVIDDLYIKIFADASQLGSGLDKAEGRLDGFSENVKKLGETLGIAFGLVEIERFIQGCIEASDASERAIAKVAQAIKQTNGVAGQSLEELRIAADSFKNSTLFDDDTVLNDVSAQLLTFTNVSGESFKRAQQAALDLATVLGDGEGLKGISIQLGKALSDPVTGLTALRRSGVEFAPVQREMIKNLVDNNRLLDAQGVILSAIELQYGGQAKAAADASNGIVQFTNSMDDSRKAIGKFLTEGGHMKTMLEGLAGSWKLMWTAEVPGSVANLLNIFKPTVEVTSSRVLGNDKPAEAKAKETLPETYQDQIDKLHTYQDSLKTATVETRAQINQQIESQKNIIKEWENAGKSVANYTGTLKGMGLEITALEEKKSTAKDPAVIAQINELIDKKKEEKKFLEGTTTAWLEYGRMVGEVTSACTPYIAKMSTEYKKLAIDVPKALEHVHDATNTLFNSMTAKNEAFSNSIEQSIKSVISSTAVSIGEMIGDLMSGTTSAHDALLGSLGKMVGQVGQMAISIGTALLAIQISLTNSANPAFALTLIGVGIAAVALGKYFSNESKSIASGSSAGGSYGSGGGGYTFDTRAAQASVPQVIELRLQGRDFVGAIEINKRYYTRQG